MPTGPARSGRPDDKLRMAEGAAELPILRAPKKMHLFCNCEDTAQRSIATGAILHPPPRAARGRGTTRSVVEGVF
jgi:hypothetical protein